MINKKKSVIIIGGNRANNFETFAPIVFDLKMNGYEVTALFQNKKIKNSIIENRILNLVYEKKKILSKSNYDLITIFKLIIYFSRYKKGIILTNRFFVSFKFRILIKILKFFNYKTIYTKSFSRPPTRNIFALVGPTPKAKSISNLSDYCILPTIDHIIEYALIGYKYNQMIISGYPKMNNNWINYCANIIKKDNINNVDILIVLGIYHDKFIKTVSDLIHKINENFRKIKVCIKPHPTNNKDILNNLTNLISNENEITLSNQNVLGLSFKSKIIITHGTSSSIDASCATENVFCYWGEEKDKVEDYKKNNFDNQIGFEILESNLLSEPFVKSSIYTKEDLNDFFKNTNLNKIDYGFKSRNSKILSITEKIENAIL